MPYGSPVEDKMQDKYFQGIHDRFARDKSFRHWMMEICRDEDVGRLRDALVDEDQTHYLTCQEYSLYKLHSNKQGSITVLVEHRSDLKEALSTLQQSKQKSRRSLTSAHVLSQKSTNGTECFFYMVELPRFMVDSWSLWKLRWRCTKYWQNGVICWMQYLEILLDTTFLNSIALLQMDRLQLTAVYCNRRRGGLNTTPQMTRCRGANVCSKWLQERMDDHDIQSDFNFKTGPTVTIQQLVRYGCVVTLHDYTTDTKDDMTSMTVFHTEHINTNTWVRLVLFIFCQRIVLHSTCTAWFKSGLCPSFHSHSHSFTSSPTWSS